MAAASPKAMVPEGCQTVPLARRRTGSIYLDLQTFHRVGVAMAMLSRRPRTVAGTAAACAAETAPAVPVVLAASIRVLFLIGSRLRVRTPEAARAGLRPIACEQA
jgi:hypothetical protein